MDNHEQKKAQERILRERLQHVLKYLAEGLTLQDSLVLAEVSPEEFQEYKKQNLRYAHLVKRKQVEYKRKVIRAINEGLNAKDPKIAQWLAEAKYSEEYSKKRKNDADGPEHSVTNIINLIQSGEAGQAVLPKSSQAQEKIIDAVIEPDQAKDDDEHTPIVRSPIMPDLKDTNLKKTPKKTNIKDKKQYANKK